MQTKNRGDIQVDVRGEICPYPMTKAEEAMKRIKGEEVIEVLTDHSPALTTIPWQARKLGFTWKIEEAGSAEWRILLWREPKGS